MDMHLGMGLTLTWSTIVGLAALLILFKVYWPSLTFAFKHGGDNGFRVVFSAVALIAVGAFIYALLVEPISLEISRVILWWVLGAFSYAIVSSATSGLASGFGQVFDKERQFEAIGYVIGALISILFVSSLAGPFADWTIGTRAGLALAIGGIILSVARWLKSHSRESPEQRVTANREQQLEVCSPQQTMRKVLFECLFICLTVFVVNLLIVGVSTYLKSVTTAGFAVIFRNPDRLYAVLRLATLNSITILVVTAIVLGAFELLARVFGKKSFFGFRHKVG